MIAELESGLYNCTICDYQAKTKQRMENHIEAKHSDSPGYICDICQRFCPTKNALFIHKTRHHR